MLAGIELSKPHIRVWLYAFAVHAALFSIFFGPVGTGVLFIVVGGGVIVGLARIYHDRNSFISFVGQVLYAYFVLGMLSVLRTHMRSSDLAIVTVVGLALGWSTSKAAASMAATGKWIWILPVPIFVYSFLHDWLRRCEFCPDATTVYFYSSAALDGMLTSQAFSLSGYSLGAWLASRARVQPRPPALL